jgi:hypothetical protein
MAFLFGDKRICRENSFQLCSWRCEGAKDERREEAEGEERKEELVFLPMTLHEKSAGIQADDRLAHAMRLPRGIDPFALAPRRLLRSIRFNRDHVQTLKYLVHQFAPFPLFVPSISPTPNSEVPPTASTPAAHILSLTQSIKDIRECHLCL